MPRSDADSGGPREYDARSMRRIAIINQKGGVGKTTTAVNLGAALAAHGRRVVVVDLDPQANASLHLGVEIGPDSPSSYSILVDGLPFQEALLPTSIEGLRLVGTSIDLSGAELELANAFGRETILRDAVEAWRDGGAEEPADYVLYDCPPSLGLLSINGLAASDEVFIAVQTEFFALRGMTKLVEICALIQKRLHPGLAITGIVPCLYDNRLRLAREVLGEVRRFFPGLVFETTIGTNVKLAEAPSFGRSIFEYAPESSGARDYAALGVEVLDQEREPEPEPEPLAEPTVELAPEPPRPAPAPAPSPERLA